jgi:phosphoribosylanthranilate isomerase
MVRIKVCGITNYGDALAAAELGADAIGFVFTDSPRRISPEGAARIVAELPPFIAKVGVFVDENVDVVRDIAEICGLDTLQFHGSETPEYCRLFGLQAVKAFRVKDDVNLSELARYGAGPFVLDTHIEGIAGGTGQTFDWNHAAEASVDYRIILSGGLNPYNVHEAVAKVKPYAVDVSSGIEDSPGRKDIKMLKAFILAVRHAEESV